MDIRKLKKFKDDFREYRDFLIAMAKKIPEPNGIPFSEIEDEITIWKKLNKKFKELELGNYQLEFGRPYTEIFEYKVRLEEKDKNFVSVSMYCNKFLSSIEQILLQNEHGDELPNLKTALKEGNVIKSVTFVRSGNLAVDKVNRFFINGDVTHSKKIQAGSFAIRKLAELGGGSLKYDGNKIVQNTLNRVKKTALYMGGKYQLTEFLVRKDMYLYANPNIEIKVIYLKDFEELKRSR